MFKLINQKSQFDWQLYLTLYHDVYVSGIDPKDHYDQYGKLENRYCSVLEFGGSQSNYKIDEKKRIYIEVPWIVKRKEWGWLVVSKCRKLQKQNHFDFNINFDESLDLNLVNLTAELNVNPSRCIVNFSQVGQRKLLFLNIGFK